MHPRNGASSATPAASTEPWPNVRLDDEHSCHNAASRPVASLLIAPLLRVVSDIRLRSLCHIAEVGDHPPDLTKLAHTRDGALAIPMRPTDGARNRLRAAAHAPDETAGTRGTPAALASPPASYRSNGPSPKPASLADPRRGAATWNLAAGCGPASARAWPRKHSPKV
jgi:hypothetical protein